MVTIESKITIPKDVLFRELSGEAVILNLQNGKYYGLDEVGTRMWNLLSEYGSIVAAYQTLLAEYEVDEAKLKSDLLQLVDQLAAQGLIQVEDE